MTPTDEEIQASIRALHENDADRVAMPHVVHPNDVSLHRAINRWGKLPMERRAGSRKWDRRRCNKRIRRMKQDGDLVVTTYTTTRTDEPHCHFEIVEKFTVEPLSAEARALILYYPNLSCLLR